MIYRKVECPHCGNETVVKKIREGQKCEWCRRLIKATFYQIRKGKKWFCDVETLEFPDNSFEEFKKSNVNELEEGQ